MSQEMKITFKKMTESELSQVHDIEARVFADPWSENAFLSDIKNEFAYPLVALFENKVAGYASLYCAIDEMQIGNLAVSPDYHQRGIGTKIVEHIISLAIDMKMRLIVLEVRESNAAACKLYSKFGFKEAGRRKYYYRKPVEDALILIKGIE
jgi:ribosomal-protein-alanine N-acetyltransferase